MTRRVGYLAALLVVAALAVVSAAWIAVGSRDKEAVALGPGRESALSAPYGLLVDLGARRLYVMEDGAAVRSYPVAVGSPKHPTPTGNYAIRHIVWNPRWVPPDAKWARNKKPKDPGAKDNPVGSVKMFFADPDYYIHGTREYDSLGEAESHGCVRMANPTVIDLAQEVMAHGGKPVPEGWVDRVLDHFRETRQVYLSRPIPVTVRG